MNEVDALPPELKPATSFPQAYARLETFLADAERFDDSQPMWMLNGTTVFWGDLRRLFHHLSEETAAAEFYRSRE